ncbi:MAG: PQQ-binding-like beta-propeller repeat protein [Candidatus Saccharimonas sp.]|nr:PQQ-binding-like beta-propeller repeat protein [Planctomycetaceae bacterium]
MRTTTSSLVAFLTLTALAMAGDWRQFRGNDTTGVSEEASLPVKWSATENIGWKSALPGRGLSSPIIVGDRVFVTCSSGYRQDRLHVLCFSAADGSPVWERQFTATGRTMSHPKTCNAAPTPASDGRRIFALYSSNDLVCLDLDGNLLWYRGLTFDHPNVSNSLGMASSPVVVGDTLVAQVENDSESLATGVDVATGLSRWTMTRPKRANWTSAAVLGKGAGSDEDLVLLQSSEGLAAIQPLTGKVVWNYKEGASTIPSSVVSDGVIYIPSQGITAIRPPQNSANIEVLWRVGKLGPQTASPIVYQGRLYCVNGAGVLLCGDTKTGEEKWKLRMTGPFTGSPVAAGGHLYFFNETGEAHVVKPGDEQGELVATNKLDETFLCTPAIANGAIYIRSDKTLWKIATK